MNKKRRQLHPKLLAPALCLSLLGAMYAEGSRRLEPANVEPYHTRARAAVEGVRYTVGYWTGADMPIPESAQQLLKPNGLLSRVYVNNDPAFSGGAGVGQASLLIVQCRDPRDMQGHYPPICYPAHGATRAGEEPMTFLLPATATEGAMEVRATEYRFRQSAGGERRTTAVLNTLLIPGVGTTPDMRGIYKAAEDYQRRLYGAAQLQVVMSDDVPPDTRRETYRQFLEGCAGTIRALVNIDQPGHPPQQGPQGSSKKDFKP